MRLVLENQNGKPVVRLGSENNTALGNLAALHHAISQMPSIKANEARWLGVCCVMFAVLSLAGQSRFDQNDILKVLDAFYFRFTDPQISKAFQDGEHDGIDLVREAVINSNEDDIVNIFAKWLAKANSTDEP